MDNTPTISFATLSRFLIDLGFQHKSVEEPFEVFVFGEKDAMLLFRSMDSDDHIDPSQWASIRHTLLGKSILSKAQLTAWLHSVGALGGKIAS